MSLEAAHFCPNVGRCVVGYGLAGEQQQDSNEESLYSPLTESFALRRSMDAVHALGLAKSVPNSCLNKLENSCPNPRLPSNTLSSKASFYFYS